MALNLWKVGGQSTGYNPLPTGLGNKVKVPSISNYTITFVAYSPSSAQLKLGVDNGITQIWTLTPVPTNYSYTFADNNTSYTYLIDYASKGDIVVNNINLVQAPLNQLTINGVDGFLSGKWTIHANAKIIDDMTLQLNATAAYQASRLLIKGISPSTTYTISRGNTDNSYIYAQCQDSNGNPLGTNSTALSSISFTTPANTAQILFSFDNSSYTSGTYILSKPVLNLGTVKTPYSKKTGDVMQLPTASKNLYYPYQIYSDTDSTYSTSGDWSVDTIKSNVTDTDNYIEFRANHFSGSFQTYPALPNTTYTFSADIKSDGVAPAQLRVIPVNSSGGAGASVLTTAYYGTSPTRVSLTVTSNPDTSGFLIRLQNGITTAGASAYMRNIQMEKNVIATPYTPYAVQVNKSPQRYISTKNLLKPITDITDNPLAIGNGTYTINSNYSLTVNGTNWNAGFNAKSDILPAGKTYTLSATANNAVSVDVYNPDGSVLVSNSPFINSSGVTTPIVITTAQNGAHTIRFKNSGQVETYTISNWQLESGSSPTAFVPYTAVLPPANTGLRFNGILGNYINTPNISINQNIHLTADFSTTVIPSANAMIVDQFNPTYGISVFINSAGYICYRFGGSGAYNSTINVCDGFKHRAEIVVVNGTVSWFLDGVQLGGSVSGYSGGSLNVPIAIGQRTNGNTYPFTGTIYKVSMSGDANFNYDFTNPQTIVGNTVLSGVKQNLIPNFESSGWTINSDGKILGKDFLRHDITGSYRPSIVKIPIKPSTNYLLLFGGVSATNLSGGNTFWKMFEYDINKSTTATYGSLASLFYRITTSATSVTLELDIGSEFMPSGHIDIYKPMIIQSDGMEGTIYGSPTFQLKPPKRTLYNLR